MADLPEEARRYKPENRERCRHSIASLIEPATRDDKKVVTVERVVQAGSKDRNATTTLLRLWREGKLSIADAWDDAPATPSAPAPPVPSDLGERVRAARTDGDREALLHELAALVADGALDPEQAAQIRAALAEARQAAEMKREAEPPQEDPTRLLLASELALLVARTVDRCVSPERRERIAAYVARELEQDLDEERNTDQGGAP